MAGKGDEVIGVFLNRLSDFLFVAARLDAHNAGATEQAYKIQWRVEKVGTVVLQLRSNNTA